jgi:hypothetical protein
LSGIATSQEKERPRLLIHIRHLAMTLELWTLNLELLNLSTLQLFSLHFSQDCVARWWGPLPHGRSIKPVKKRRIPEALGEKNRGEQSPNRELLRIWPQSGTQAGQIRMGHQRLAGSGEGACGAAKSAATVAIL